MNLSIAPSPPQYAAEYAARPGPPLRRDGNGTEHVEMPSALQCRFGRSEFRAALRRKEFNVVYQPKMSLADGSITGVEALLRWCSPVFGQVPPDVFIPLAEKCGAIGLLGNWMLRCACAQVARWRIQQAGVLRVAVNVSMCQLLGTDLVSQVEAALDLYHLPGSMLELELTESVLMVQPARAVLVLNSMRRLGVHISIDDFGTGYSSLAYLKRFPVDTIKIDREFVSDMLTDRVDDIIMSAVIAMAHALGLDVVAEGVETSEQLEHLRSLGCDEVQGFFLGPPIDAEGCVELIKSHAPDRVCIAALVRAGEGCGAPRHR